VKKRDNNKPIQTVNEAKKLAHGLNPGDKIRMEGRMARHPGLYKHASRKGK
jgi:hypothetical protein